MRYMKKDPGNYFLHHLEFSVYVSLGKEVYF